MNLFEFTPNETGYDSFYVMSHSLEEAIEAIKNISDPLSSTDFEKYRHKYRIKIFKENEATWTSC